MKEQKESLRKTKNEKKMDQQKESFANRLKQDARSCLKDIHKRDIGILFLFAFCVNLIVETLHLMKYDGVFGAFMKLLPNFGYAQSSSNEVFAGFMGLFTHPLKVLNDPIIFLYNVLIVMVVLSFALLFKKRYFVMTLLSALWVTFGVANFIILSYRVTPFSAVELRLIDAALGVMKSYVTGVVFVVVISVLVLAVASLVFVWIRAPRIKRVNRVSSAIVIAGTFLLVFLGTFLGTESGVVASKLPNLSVNYQEYGFVYCFVSSFKTGIGKPNDYSEAKIKQIKDDTEKKLHNTDTTNKEPEVSEAPQTVTSEAVRLADEDMPNILFLQLESFFDITALDGLELSEDPIPNFRQCMEQYSSGFLSVPSVGAGTANTEFEIMTGMNLDFFGPGEYPYRTVLLDKSCETICYNLKEHGYATHAIHNNRATFYGRNSVFKRFGYDSFTTIELMNVQEFTESGWAKDKILTGEILETLDSTEGKDYIYTISVQGHGEYPETESQEEPVITVDGGISDVGNKYRIQYYVNQIHEMDQFLNELIDALNQRDEDTILVVYGDHLPNLNITEDQLTVGDMFQTQYFVWNNMNLPVDKEDVEAYQLAAKVLKSVGITDGAVNAFHQANWDIRGTDEYLKDLENLGYDMLYGDNNVTEGKNAYEPTKMVYGVKNVEVTSVYRDQSDTDYLIVKGDHFTNYSVVLINGEKVSNTKFVDENTLRIHLEKQTEDAKIVVQQSYKGKLVLQTSNEVDYSCENEEDVYNDGDSEEIQEEEEDDLAGLLEEQSGLIGDEKIEQEQND